MSFTDLSPTSRLNPSSTLKRFVANKYPDTNVDRVLIDDFNDEYERVKDEIKNKTGATDIEVKKVENNKSWYVMCTIGAITATCFLYVLKNGILSPITSGGKRGKYRLFSRSNKKKSKKRKIVDDFNKKIVKQNKSKNRKNRNAFLS